MTDSRVIRVRRLMADKQLDAVLVTHPINRRYISGFTGSHGSLLITGSRAVLITDFRYTEQAAAQAPDFEIIKAADLEGEAARLAGELGLQRLGFEGGYMPFDQHRSLAEAMGSCVLVSVSGLIETLRLVKESLELDAMRRAAQIADEAWNHVLGWIKPEVAERDLALELEFQMKRLGAENLAFDIIVASGVRSALPHGRASEKRIGHGELVTFDFGAVYRGYNSDMTRTVMVGEPSAKQREIYETVLEAQLRGVSACRPGMTGGDLDEVCRGYIREKGYADAFGHGTGHGVGLEVHEGPRARAGWPQVLQPGMVVTIEPGVYVPGFGGVRIEDMVLVTDQGCESFSRSPKDLLIL